MHCETNTQDRLGVPNPICRIHQKLTSNQRKMPTRIKKRIEFFVRVVPFVEQDLPLGMSQRRQSQDIEELRRDSTLI